MNQLLPNSARREAAGAGGRTEERGKARELGMQAEKPEMDVGEEERRRG